MGHFPAMLPRILEPEIMDSAGDAREYDAMDHARVNEVFVTDLLHALTDWSLKRPVQSMDSNLRILDLGAGTAQIPIALARRAPRVHITAVDAAQSMLAIARRNIARAGLADRIAPLHADAKKLACGAGTFQAVISNSIIHHIPEPRDVVSEAIRVVAPDGLLLHRDLCRPHNLPELERIVDTHAAGANAHQRKLFSDSLHAALTVDEVQRLVAEFGYAPETVRKTSDRHWTWTSSALQSSVPRRIEGR